MDSKPPSSEARRREDTISQADSAITRLNRRRRRQRWRINTTPERTNYLPLIIRLLRLRTNQCSCGWPRRTSPSHRSECRRVGDTTLLPFLDVRRLLLNRRHRIVVFDDSHGSMSKAPKCHVKHHEFTYASLYIVGWFLLSGHKPRYYRCCNAKTWVAPTTLEHWLVRTSSQFWNRECRPRVAWAILSFECLPPPLSEDSFITS